MYTFFETCNRNGENLAFCTFFRACNIKFQSKHKTCALLNVLCPNGKTSSHIHTYVMWVAIICGHFFYDRRVKSRNQSNMIIVYSIHLLWSDRHGKL